MNIDEYVERMPEQLRLTMIKDYEQFRRDGFIGDCVLRAETRAFQQQLGMSKVENITLWMEQLANAAYRLYAYRYLSLTD